MGTHMYRDWVEAVIIETARHCFPPATFLMPQSLCTKRNLDHIQEEDE